MKLKITTIIYLFVSIFFLGTINAQTDAIKEASKLGVMKRASITAVQKKLALKNTVKAGIPITKTTTPKLKATAKSSLIHGRTFYGYNAYQNSSAIPHGPVRFNSSSPNIVTSLANQGLDSFINGSSWANGQWYATEHNTNLFVTVDTSTGNRTVLGALGIEMNGLAYDWTTSVMYAIGTDGYTSNLYSINMNTYAVNYIGIASTNYLVGLGCDLNGNLYSVDIESDEFVAVDKTNPSTVALGPLGFDANYTQEIEFDNSTNTMYYAAFNIDDFSGELYTVNLLNGSLSLIGSFDGGMELTGLCIPNQFYSHDIGASGISHPGSGPGLGNNEEISVDLYNAGFSDENDVPIYYSVNNGPVVSEVVSGSFPSSASITYDFDQKADLSVPNVYYSIKVWVGLPGDQNSDNDTLTIVVYNGMEYCTSGSQICYDYISQVLFGTISNSSNCTVNGYADYTTQSASISYGQTANITVINGQSGSYGMCGIWIDWNQDGDFANDAQVIAFTNGDQFDASVNVPNNALPGITRMRIKISSSDYPTPCNFTYNGETEDYTVVVTGQPVQNDVGISQILSPLIVNTLPFTYTPEVEIANYGSLNQSSVSVSYSVDNGTPVTEIFSGNLNSGSVISYMFNQSVSFSNCGNHSLTYYTSLPADEVNSNDTLKNTVIASMYLTIAAATNVQQLVNSILPGNGITISNISFTGDSVAIGTFDAKCSTLGLDSGLVLASGYVTTALGPNTSSSAGSDLGLNGDLQLTALSGMQTYDAAVLEFDIVPQYDTIQFRYVFGSEEYPEYVNQYNDVFAFFVNGPKPGGSSYVNANIALVPGTTDVPVSINTINNGISDNGPCQNCEYYITNLSNELELDAYTTVLTASFIAIPGASYHLKIAIADALDHVYDSDVFLEKGSFSSPSGNVSLSGQVEYDNNAETKLPNVIVKLKQNGIQVAQTTTNAYGNYEFSNLAPGTYNIEAESNAPWGGGNSIDGLAILKHFVAVQYLHDLFLKAGDLNGDNTLNSTDALLDLKRFVGMITSFPIGSDWIFEEDTITITGNAPVVYDFKGLCRGDVNGSFIP